VLTLSLAMGQRRRGPQIVLNAQRRIIFSGFRVLSWVFEGEILLERSLRARHGVEFVFSGDLSGTEGLLTMSMNKGERSHWVQF